MNLGSLNMAYRVGSSLWNQFAEFRDEKARQTYDALEEAADKVDNHTQDWFPGSRKEAGRVTQAAHSRLERALEDIKSQANEAQDKAKDKTENATANLRKSATEARKKSQKKAIQLERRAQDSRKSATKAAKKARKQATKKQKKQNRSAFWPIAAVVAAVAAIGGGVYYWLRRNDTPSEQPPRVEEFGGNEQTAGSTLVYTSTTEKPVSTQVEEGVVDRDEELLGSLDAQLANHQAETAERPEEDTARLTDDSDNEGKHRLREDED
ncbi:hypothetical protein [Corynebacterium confusum]|uniref:hypothetical protein n=1 Tax=Corynebacterium confusum TaxID=71254 RepID=UPI0025B35C67|nr:hypothetical protein [Corynebacterium confusum]WJY88598.1 hypothetical protein CCONF_00125 [Corynebacterium confusum]